LSAKFTVPTQKIGLVDISIECSFESFDQWWKYKIGPQGWNDSQVRDEEAHNRLLEMYPDCLLRISHEFSDAMPTVEIPQRTPWDESQMDAFDMVGDEMTNLENDTFETTVKMNDLGETIRQWFFKPMQGGRDSRRVHQEEYKEVEHQISVGLFSAKEDIFQRYNRLT